MNSGYLDKIIHADCREHLGRLDDDSIELLLSDIPYGIALDDWDVLHSNQNSALLGESPAQRGKPAFKRRGKPINGWSRSDRNIGREYEEWCRSWAQMVFPKLKSGSSVLLFGARRTIHRVVNAFEDSGFLLKDMLAWKKKSAYHRGAEGERRLRKARPAEGGRTVAWLALGQLGADVRADCMADQTLLHRRHHRGQRFGTRRRRHQRRPLRPSRGRCNQRPRVRIRQRREPASRGPEATRPNLVPDRLDDPGRTNRARSVCRKRHDGGCSEATQPAVHWVRGRERFPRSGMSPTVE